MTETFSEEKARRYYDRLRERIHAYAEGKGKVAGKTSDFLLLVPDMFLLLWRLAGDGRVSGRNKALLGSGIAYFLFPLDLVPELFLGPAGFLDDLVFAAYIVNRMLADTPPEILRRHWSGREDVLAAVQRVLGSADQLVRGDLLRRLKRMMR
ncbi:MAG TPA: DUF1232 domain-containing protein [Thermoanaerobaculia bacterium]|nr:DUF1232 domain-containing protein [Thermoanaerobaculia bacterium]